VPNHPRERDAQCHEGEYQPHPVALRERGLGVRNTCSSVALAIVSRPRVVTPALNTNFWTHLESACRAGVDRDERRGRILDVFNRGVRQRARTAAATAMGEFESVVLAAMPVS
jgi:hypothetical protein